MVSLLTTPVRKCIALGGRSPTLIYVLLLVGGYLAWRALIDPRFVLAQIRRGVENWDPHDRPIMPGSELPRSVEQALAEHHLLSAWAKSWGSRGVSRGRLW